MCFGAVRGPSLMAEGIGTDEKRVVQDQRRPAWLQEEITRRPVMPSSAWGPIVMVMKVFVIWVLAAHGGVIAARLRRPVGAEPKGTR